MIFGLHRQPSGLRIERWPLGHGPRQQHAVVLEAEVVVQVAGKVFLHTEEALGALRCDDAFGFGGLLEIAFAFVFFERHYRTPSIMRLTGLTSANTIADVTNRMIATSLNSCRSGIVLKNPAAHPASLLPKAFDSSHTPIIKPTIRGGDSLVTA